MVYVDPLTKSETNSLQEIIRNHLLAWTRIRATAVLLSNQKIPLQSIASISGACRVSRTRMMRPSFSLLTY